MGAGGVEETWWKGGFSIWISIPCSFFLIFVLFVGCRRKVLLAAGVIRY